ncbi:MAG: hypothetical protein ACE5JM_05615, partial [Armatimonadota bacterium]
KSAASAQLLALGRVALGVYPDGNPALVITDAHEKLSITLAHLDAAGKTGLHLFDDGKQRAMLTVAPDGSPGLSLNDKGGRMRAGLELLADGNPRLGLLDKRDRIRGALGLTGDGEPLLALTDKDEKLLWSAP